MHVIEHILMSEAQNNNNNNNADAQERLQALEARALAEATASADAAFVPSASLWNATTPSPLLEQVDGPSLSKYHGKESIYVGRSVPLSAGKTLKVPIQVSSPGSVVEYSVENKSLDVGFGITAEREQGVTIVKQTDRIDASQTPVTGKFLIGSVPCLITFSFENDYSYFREKVVSYRITVKPPSLDTLMAGRRRRAKACLKAVQEDSQLVLKKLDTAKDKKKDLQTEVETLNKRLEQLKKDLAAMELEETAMKDRVTVRLVQAKALTQRLEEGWNDEQEAAALQ